SIHATNFAIATMEGAAALGEAVITELATAGVGHYGGASVHVVQRGWWWWRRTRISVKVGKKTVDLSKEVVDQYRKTLGKSGQPASYDDVKRAIQNALDAPRPFQGMTNQQIV